MIAINRSAATTTTAAPAQVPPGAALGRRATRRVCQPGRAAHRTSCPHPASCGPDQPSHGRPQRALPVIRPGAGHGLRSAAADRLGSTPPAPSPAPNLAARRRIVRHGREEHSKLAQGSELRQRPGVTPRRFPGRRGGCWCLGHSPPPARRLERTQRPPRGPYGDGPDQFGADGVSLGFWQGWFWGQSRLFRVPSGMVVFMRCAMAPRRSGNPPRPSLVRP